MDTKTVIGRFGTVTQGTDIVKCAAIALNSGHIKYFKNNTWKTLPGDKAFVFESQGVFNIVE